MFAHSRRMKPLFLIATFILALLSFYPSVLYPLGALPAQAAACTWTGATNTEWTTAGNWTDCGGEVPDSGDTATIPALSNQPVIGLASEVTINGLVINAGASLNVDGMLTLQGVGGVSEDGDLTIRSGGKLNWSSGTMRGDGTTTIDDGAELVISGNSTKTLDGRALLNAGTILFQGTGELDLYNSASITNSGIFEVQNDERLWSAASSASFHNSGTLLKSAGSEMTEVDLIFNNSGTVEVESGFLRLDGGGMSPGSFSVAQAAILGFGGGTHELELNSAVSGQGELIVSSGTVNINDGSSLSGAQTTITGGTLNFNTTDEYEFTQLELNGGTLSGDSDITITEMMTWTGGRMEGSGMTTIAEAANLMIAGTLDKRLDEGRLLVNAGMAVVQESGGLDLLNGASVSNSGTFDLQENHWFWSAGGEGIFANSGTLLKSAGDGLSEFDLTLNNTGLVRVETGTLRVDGGGTSSGTFETVAETSFQIGGSTFTLADNSVLSGNFILSTGTLNAESLTIAGNLTNNGGTFNAASGTVTFSGGLSQTVAFNSSSTFNDVVVAAGTTLLETGSRNRVTVNGSLTNNGLIRSTLPVDAIGQHRLGLTGAELYVDTVGSLVSVEAEHIGSSHPNADDKTDTGQYWHLEPNGIAYVVDIILPHTQIDTSSTEVCRYVVAPSPHRPLAPSQMWECRQDAADAESVTWADFSWSANNALEDADWAVGITSNASETTIEPNASGTLASEDSSIIIEIPAGGVNEPTNLSLTPLKAPTYSAPSGLAFAGQAFDFRAFRNGQELPNFLFQDAINMRVHYDDAEITGLNESALELYYWDGSAWATTLLGEAEINAGLNRLEVTAANTAEFALFGPTGCVAVMDIKVVGPAQGITGVQYSFSAVITPTAATLPITYNWTPEPVAGQGSAQATFLWNEEGSFAPSVSVVNCQGNATDNGSINIAAPPAAATADAYEADNVCAQAQSILTDGSSQTHTFHEAGDSDWVSFSANAGTTVVIDAITSPSSNADVVLELYNECDSGTVDGQDHTFSEDVRLIYQISSSNNYYLRLSNHEPNVYGDDYSYQLSVQAAEAPPQGALVLVAGKLNDNDPLQENIHNTTNAVYELALQNGCTADDIYYLATDASLPGVDDDITPQTLDYAITDWAVERVGENKRFTLYAMDHGAPDIFYLNGSSVTINPNQLDGWLDELEAQVPDLESNIIMEACYSGSFIAPSQQISQAGRLVMASTGADKLAYATTEGAIFSDTFLDTLGQGQTLKTAFQASLWTAQQAHPDQTPWLDADGDGIPNELEDTSLALTHGFACAASPNTENWAPSISEVQFQELSDGNLGLWATVQDDKDSVGQGVEDVWAVVFPPSYEPPTESNELVLEEQYLERPPVAMIATNANNLYGALYPALTETGTYRIVIHAIDEEGTVAQPKVIEFQNGEEGHQIYLPLTVRQ